MEDIYGTVDTKTNSSDGVWLRTQGISVLETRNVPPFCTETFLPYAHPQILFTNLIFFWPCIMNWLYV